MGSAVSPDTTPASLPLLLFHKESFPSMESCLPDSLLCFLLPLPSPWAHPHPVLLVCNGAWRQMRSFDIQTEIQEDRAQIKNWAHSFLSAPFGRRYLAAWFTVLYTQSSACTQACCFSFRLSLWCLTWYIYFFLFFQAADYSVSALGNVILALLFVVLMYLESPTLGAAIIFYQPVKVS